MAYVLLYGQGWTQRWQIARGAVGATRAEVERVGRNETGHLAVLDPGTGELATLVMSWHQVAVAVVLGDEDSPDEDTAGSYR